MAASIRQSQYQKYMLNIVALYQRRADLKAYTEILLSIAAVIFFIIFAIKPTIVTIANLITKINAEQQTSDQMTTKINNLSIAQGLYNEQTNNINFLNQAVPNGPDVATYVRQIEGMIKKDGLTAITIGSGDVSIITPTATSSAQKLVSTISVSGSYEQLTSFISDIETLRRPAIIGKLDFALTDISQGQKGLTLTISPQTPFNQK
ncbi:MAG TPA: type 4a pilus biogenesis protein PilO [Candidatus Saccharimonadales bacterium]|nr:type 4a pilus biogenesis protein PilO [Candidatus Saccharimonadales bacterium]